MKTIIYLKIAKTKGERILVEAKTKQNLTPLKSVAYPKDKWLPTLFVPLEIEVDDKHFSGVADLLNLKITSPKPAVEIKEVLEEANEVDD